MLSFLPPPQLTPHYAAANASCDEAVAACGAYAGRDYLRAVLPCRARVRRGTHLVTCRRLLPLAAACRWGRV